MASSSSSSSSSSLPSASPASSTGKTRVSATLEVDAVFKDGPLGMGLKAKGGRVYVKSVADEGQAREQGVKVGDLIYEVEGELTSQFTVKQVLVCLKKAERPLSLGFRRKNPEYSAADAIIALKAQNRAKAAPAATPSPSNQNTGSEAAAIETTALQVAPPSAAAAAERRREEARAAERLRSRPTVFFEVMADGAVVLGRMEFELYGDVVPRTAENFRSLCTGERGRGRLSGKKLHFKGSVFHRIIPGFMCQGGDITKGNGSGGESIYGRTFDDENFTIKHTQPGLLSMANAGPNTQSSQFFITTSATPWLDNKHVVFGRIKSGFKVLKELESYGTKSGFPCAKLQISDCGEVVAQAEALSRGASSSSIKTSTSSTASRSTEEVISSEPVLSAEGQRRKAEKDAARAALQQSILTASEQAHDLPRAIGVVTAALAAATPAGGGVLSDTDRTVAMAKNLLSDLRAAVDEEEEERERLQRELDAADSEKQTNVSEAASRAGTGYQPRQKRKLDFNTLQRLGGFTSFFESDDYQQIKKQQRRQDSEKELERQQQLAAEAAAAAAKAAEAEAARAKISREGHAALMMAGKTEEQIRDKTKAQEEFLAKKKASGRNAMMGEKLRAQEEERIRKEQARRGGASSGKSFNAKEKLKRSRGQSGRGKSAVEEEKRLLKNMPGGGGFGFD